MGSSQSTPTTPVKGVPEEPIVRPKQEDNTPFPIPTGHEYDAIDRIAAELPNVIDDESRQQVEDYRQACDNGKGPMVRTTANTSCCHLLVVVGGGSYYACLLAS